MKPAAARIAALLMVGLPLLAACSGSGSSTQSTAAPTPTISAAQSPTASPTASPTVALTGPDAACKTALTQQFDAGAAAADAGEKPADPVEPSACKGVDKAKIKSWTDAMAQAWIQQHLTTTTN